MANRNVVAIGTSAGGVEALRHLAGTLPADLPAAVLVTIHLPSQYRSVLDEVLSRAGPLPASFAVDGEPVLPGRIYIALPDRHLIMAHDRLWLGVGPRENNVRPAIDPMLRSVGMCCGGRAIGVVLTGTLGDGASGLWAIGQCGGLSVVQAPEDAAFPDMPLNALALTKPDHVAPLRELPFLLARLTREPAGRTLAPPPRLRLEVEIARTGRSSMEEMDRVGKRSFFACPDCHGVMWEIQEGELFRYRCHVGHTYSADVMAVALDENLRRALASAQRALEERVELARKLWRQAERNGHDLVARNWAEKVRYYEGEMEVVRDAVRQMEGIAASSVAE